MQKPLPRSRPGTHPTRPGHSLFRPLAASLAVALLALPAAGCGTTAAFAKDLTPEVKAEIARAFIENCKGTVNITAGGATGQLGGGFQANFQLSGTCDGKPVPQESLQ